MIPSFFWQSYNELPLSTHLSQVQPTLICWWLIIVLAFPTQAFT
jgi:hypothetical protein